MKNSKTIWFVYEYASTPETGIGGRQFYLAQELAKQGHKVYIIASTANHLLRNKPEFTNDITFEPVADFTFVWIKMPEYVGAHSKQRALNWFLFSWRIQKLKKLIKDKPDAILFSSPSLIPFLGTQRLANYFSAKLIFEIRDIWPLTLTKVGDFSPAHPFIRLMQWVENKAYRDSDRVVSNLKNSVEHMVEHGLQREKFTWVANGFSLDEVSQTLPLSRAVERQLPENKFIVGYTGTLGFANALDTLIEAAEILNEQDDIAFVLVGQGKEKEKLQSLAKEKNLDNITFIDAIPKVQIQAMLSKFNACFIGWLKDDLYKFGIGANKIPEYLYSGKPIIHAYSGACDPIAQFKAGLTTEAENSQALADTILKLYHMTESERNKMGANGRKAALEEYEYGMLAKKLETVLFD